MVALPQQGGCPCGAVRLTLAAAPLLAYVCHCHDCQKRSGSAFTLTLVAGAADVLRSGPTRVKRHAMRSGRQIDQSSCATCGHRVLAPPPVAPDFVSFPAGVLDDASWMRPIAQTWVESAIPWAVIPGVRSVAWEDFDFASLGREWRATAPRFGVANGE